MVAKHMPLLYILVIIIIIIIIINREMKGYRIFLMRGFIKTNRQLLAVLDLQKIWSKKYSFHTPLTEQPVPF